MKTKSVLISGASVAGPSLAWWLTRYGFKVTIIERSNGIRPGGYAVDFRGTAMKVLDKMGLTNEVRKYEMRSGKINIVNKQNRKIAAFPDGFTSGELEIMRGDLANVLYEATRHEVEYIFNDTITAINEDAHGVEVIFACAETRRFDLVFGADGLHSKVRSLVFGDESKFIHHLGLYISIFTVSNFMNLGMDAVYYGELGRRVGVFGADQGAEAKVSFYFASPAFKYDYRDIAQQKEVLREKFAECDWEVPRLLEMMDEAPDFYFDSISQIKMDSWHKGRVALLGDAAHCASPMAGMGTSMALIGAYILAGELNDWQHDYAAAFTSYESQMRDFVTRCQGMADGVDWFVPKTRFKQWLGLQIWKILPYTPLKNMMIEMPKKLANSISVKDYVSRQVNEQSLTETQHLFANAPVNP
jgi:2-polyprenyl-6-methoxyphenol hydroxylase-like FAD-dependent oxidoreductase